MEGQAFYSVWSSDVRRIVMETNTHIYMYVPPLFVNPSACVNF